MQLEWLRLTRQPGLIVAPLAVAQQTIREAANIGIDLTYARKESECKRLTITNYEMMGNMPVDKFNAVVLDESSRLKDESSKTRNQIIKLFQKTAWKLCCSATPAPNDHDELGNHSEHLNVMTKAEMQSAFFIHDDKGWRLKGHARRAFWRWLASWGMSLNTPSDLGYSDEGYILPPLEIIPIVIDCDATPADRLFFGGLRGIGDRVRVRKATAKDRVAAAAGLALQEPDEQWAYWCGLNEESEALAKVLPDNVHVFGAQHPEIKSNLLMKFIDGNARCLITKPSIAGHGLNMQRCARVVFVGIGDSFELYHQVIGRFVRFGQKRSVKIYIVLSEPECEIYENVLRKQREFNEMNRELIREVVEFERQEMMGVRGKDEYNPTQKMEIPKWM
jgi:hypothetical protein